jgi:uncharacterized protein (DUF983 family)
MQNEITPAQYYKIVNSCPVCGNKRLYYYYDTAVSNIDVVCAACKRFLIVINEDRNSKNIHLHIYQTQSIVKGIMSAHQTEFKDW